MIPLQRLTDLYELQTFLFDLADSGRLVGADLQIDFGLVFLLKLKTRHFLIRGSIRLVRQLKNEKYCKNSVRFSNLFPLRFLVFLCN